MKEHFKYLVDNSENLIREFIYEVCKDIEGLRIAYEYDRNLNTYILYSNFEDFENNDFIGIFIQKTNALLREKGVKNYTFSSNQDELVSLLQECGFLGSIAENKFSPKIKEIEIEIEAIQNEYFNMSLANLNSEYLQNKVSDEYNENKLANINVAKKNNYSKNIQLAA